MNPDDNSYSAQSQQDQSEDGRVEYKQDSYSDAVNTGVGIEVENTPGGVTSVMNTNEGNPGQTPGDLTFGVDTGDQSEEDVDESSDWETINNTSANNPGDKVGVSKDLVKGIADDLPASNQSSSYKNINLDEEEPDANELDLEMNDSEPEYVDGNIEELMDGDAVFDTERLGQINDQDKQRLDVSNGNNIDTSYDYTDKEGTGTASQNEGDPEDQTTTGRMDEN